MILSKPHIATAAFVFFGGQTIDPCSLEAAWVESADDSWPDAMILLEPGVVIRKHYERNGGTFGGSGYIEFLKAGEDSLLVFTAALMELINERCVQIEDPRYFSVYIQGVLDATESQRVQFSIRRPLAGRSPIWGR
jgi:hypothetical protein